MKIWNRVCAKRHCTSWQTAESNRATLYLLAVPFASQRPWGLIGGATWGIRVSNPHFWHSFCCLHVPSLKIKHITRRSPRIYNAFEQANNFYSPGILYGVDSDKNSYVVADLTKEKVEILHYDAAPLFASFEGDNVCLGLVVS
jgi:hypothetical protein